MFCYSQIWSVAGCIQQRIWLHLNSSQHTRPGTEYKCSQILQLYICNQRQSVFMSSTYRTHDKSTNASAKWPHSSISSPYTELVSLSEEKSMFNQLWKPPPYTFNRQEAKMSTKRNSFNFVSFSLVTSWSTLLCLLVISTWTKIIETATGLNEWDIRLTANLYRKQTTFVQSGKVDSRQTAIRRGVRQGCILSSLRSNIYSEQIFAKALEEQKMGYKLEVK